jgi:hypothetical protein
MWSKFLCCYSTQTCGIDIKMNRYLFNANNNDQRNIPFAVLDTTRKLCAGSHVIDYGAGSDPQMHLEFEALTHTRIDIDGVVVSPIYGPVGGLEEAICITPENTPIVLLFF